MQTVEVRTDSECGSCGAKGDILFIRQSETIGKVSKGQISRFCNPCFRQLTEIADLAIGAFSNEHRRWPEVSGEKICIG